MSGRSSDDEERSPPVGREMYLPEARGCGAAREGHIPNGMTFRTKPEIALETLDRIRMRGERRGEAAVIAQRPPGFRRGEVQDKLLKRIDRAARKLPGRALGICATARGLGRSIEPDPEGGLP